MRFGTIKKAKSLHDIGVFGNLGTKRFYQWDSNNCGSDF